jgi:hypothetical protein
MASPVLVLDTRDHVSHALSDKFTQDVVERIGKAEFGEVRRIDLAGQKFGIDENAVAVKNQKHCLISSQ